MMPKSAIRLTAITFHQNRTLPAADTVVDSMLAVAVFMQAAAVGMSVAHILVAHTLVVRILAVHIPAVLLLPVSAHSCYKT